MAFLLAHISLVFGAACSVVLLFAMSAVTTATLRYLSVMETSRLHVKAEEESRYLRPRR